jgi:hypothetical protein
MRTVGRTSDVVQDRLRDGPLPARADLRPTTYVVRSRIASVLSIALATLREIFDENAYARFLQHHRLEPSRASYAAFLRENASRRERRPRCC